jgi:hypothetical protein
MDAPHRVALGSKWEKGGAAGACLGGEGVDQEVLVRVSHPSIAVELYFSLILEVAEQLKVNNFIFFLHALVYLWLLPLEIITQGSEIFLQIVSLVIEQEDSIIVYVTFVYILWKTFICINILRRHIGLSRPVASVSMEVNGSRHELNEVIHFFEALAIAVVGTGQHYVGSDQAATALLHDRRPCDLGEDYSHGTKRMLSVRGDLEGALAEEAFPIDFWGINNLFFLFICWWL